MDKEKTYSQQFKDGYNYNESQVNFKTININEGRSEQWRNKTKKGNKRQKRNYLETIQSDRMFQSEGWIN